MVDSMITLYESTVTEFTNNGLGSLPDAVSCLVTEERNGVYELEMEYPITGKRYDELILRRIILAKPNPYSDSQPFRIYAITKPINGIVTVNAEHISYDMSGYPVSPFTAGTITTAFSNMKKASVIPCPFTFFTDKDTTAQMTITKPTSMRSLLGGMEGSILDTYRGEYEFDRFLVRLWNNRGSNRGVSIRYGKNLTDLEQEENCSAVYTGVYPFWYSEENGLIELSEKVVNAEGTYNFTRIYPLDLSDEWQDAPTEEQLLTKAQSYMKTNKIGVPKVSLKVSFVPLAQTEDYKNFAILETVHLCDTVNVFFPEMNVSATSQCIKTVYDVIAKKYSKIELGDAKSNLANTVLEQTQNINKTPSKTFMEQAIDNATRLITGGLGGYVILHSSTGGKHPDEILIMDTPDIQTAKDVWRWNQNGFGHSSTGYAGPYDTAITIDGKIVADFITAGVLNGALLKADSVKSSAISVEYKNSVNTAIENESKSVRQAFKVADEELLSSITETFKNYSTTEETKSLISQTATQITSSVNTVLKSYATTTQLNTQITQTSSEIMTEVNKKVNNSDFGTKITQNYSSVRIAWNNISKYIEFSGGAINIYQSTAQGSDNLLMKMNSTGAWYYNNGRTIGQIGTNVWSGDNDFRGLVFDLESTADYMCWAHKETPGAANYIVKMIYYANDKKSKKGLHFSCDTYCNGNLYIGDNIRTATYTNGSGGLFSTTHDVSITGKTASVSGGATFRSDERKFIFYNSEDLLVDCYNNIDLHNYSILNQSDARYKTNIVPSETAALPILSQIELKSFDWIENGEHCDIGMIAQQLREVLPELVDENKETGRLSIKTDKIIPYLIKAIQELSKSDRVTLATRSLSINNISNTAGEWTDEYTEEEKSAFIALNKLKDSVKKEVECDEILIPIRNTMQTEEESGNE